MIAVHDFSSYGGDCEVGTDTLAFLQTLVCIAFPTAGADVGEGLSNVPLVK